MGIHTNGYVSGKIKHYRNLYLAEIFNSGHFMSHDKPEVAMDLLSRLLYAFDT